MNEFQDDPREIGDKDRPWGVAELLGNADRILGDAFGFLWLRGEIQSVKESMAGHVYLTLADTTERAVIDCVVFRTNARLLSYRPALGDQVRAMGELGIYQPGGRLSFVIRQMVRDGEGDLYARYLALKEKLFKEGLLDESRRRPIPPYPARVGIITSLRGSALRDVCRVILESQIGLQVIIYHSETQGERAEGRLIAALRRANRRAETDVLVLTRGGGSQSDLWLFNSEPLARAIAASAIPVITGIGHETDTTIADLVSDRRAPTPTAAAAIVVAGWLRARQAWRHYQSYIATLSRSRLTAAQLRWQKTQDLERYYERRWRAAERRLDEATSRLWRNGSTLGGEQRRRWLDCHARLLRLEPDMRGARQTVDNRSQAIRWRVEAAMSRRRERLAALRSRLRALSPEGVLARGYALVTDSRGRLVLDAATLTVGETATLRLARGRALARVERVEPDHSPDQSGG